MNGIKYVEVQIYATEAPFCEIEVQFHKKLCTCASRLNIGTWGLNSVE